MNEQIRQARRERFREMTRRFHASEEVRSMAGFTQHGRTTTLEHCQNVAWHSFQVNERLHLHADPHELVEAAMLHDFYLYDWHDGEPCRKTHGFDHPEIASRNAKHYFGSSEKVQSSIGSHMWPLTITKVPRSREALILCLVDKYCALLETFESRGRI